MYSAFAVVWACIDCVDGERACHTSADSNITRAALGVRVEGGDAFCCAYRDVFMPRAGAMCVL